MFSFVKQANKLFLLAICHSENNEHGQTTWIIQRNENFFLKATEKTYLLQFFKQTLQISRFFY